MLPTGWRGVVVEAWGASSGEYERGLFGLSVPKPPPLPRSAFTAFNANGQPMGEARHQGSPLEFHAPSQQWSRVGHEPRGVCGLRSVGLDALTFEGGGVMTAVKPHRNARGREFVDCVHASYLLAGWRLTVDLLLDAAHPGSTPASLPAMRLLAGHPGVLAGRGIEGEAIARRVPGAWLVVSNGENTRQRLALLGHLIAIIHA
jgi:hypothetical protein